MNVGDTPSTGLTKNRKRRYHHHNGHCCQPKRNPPKTRLGNGRVLVNGAGQGSDAARNFMKSDI